MDTLRRLAMGVCVLCVVGGVIRIFWPENGFKPVINTALVLYIIASVLQMHPGSAGRLPQIDWDALPQEGGEAEVRQYAENLAMETSVEALGQLLQQAGITAELELAGGVCRVTLADPADMAPAREILEENRGSLPVELLAGGDAP